MRVSRASNLCVMVDSLFAVQVQGVFAGEAGVFGVEVVELGVRRSHVRHATPLWADLSCPGRMDHGRQEADADERRKEGKEADCPWAPPLGAPPKRFRLWSLFHVVCRRLPVCRQDQAQGRGG